MTLLKIGLKINFITTPSGLPHRLMSIVREVIPNIDRLRLIQYIEVKV